MREPFALSDSEDWHEIVCSRSAGILPAGFYLRASKMLALPTLAAMPSPEADAKA
jgi:hypothetical protein